jgi:hypothetical protein
MRLSRYRRIGVVGIMVLLAGVFVLPAGRLVDAAPAPDANTVLILDSSVSGGASSREAVFAAAAGYTVEVVSNADWASKSTADFATYRAIVLGDATCATSLIPIAAAEANKGVWGPAITGNVILVGTDPVFHAPF